jgi:hypothetical protein
MSKNSRRHFLYYLAVTGTSAITGCQGNDPDKSVASTEGITTKQDRSTESPEPTAAETSSAPKTETPLITEFDISGVPGDAAGTLDVIGTVESNYPLSRILVNVRDQKEVIETDGTSPYKIATSLKLAGGVKYDIRLLAESQDGETVESTFESDYIPIDVDPANPQRLVGTHYYPWYEMHGGHEDWTDRTVSNPTLGEYSSDTKSVIDQHLAWSLEHGIQWWSVSWWGEDSGTDRALRGPIMDADRFSDIEFSILYETPGRLEEFDYDMSSSGARARLTEDLEYLDSKYFSRDNYIHIDGKPVVFFYVAGGLEGDISGAFEAAAENIEADPYVLADLSLDSPPTAPVMDVADGITSYNPYSPREDIEEVFHNNYEESNKILNLGSEVAGVDMMPVVIPGFNDTGLPSHIREDNPVLSASPSRFERVCDQVNPHLADSQAVLVTSFNEWYEDTQVEPGNDHGGAYLDIVSSKLASTDSRGFDPDGALVEFEFNKTIRPEGSTRDLSFMMTGLEFESDGEVILSYDIGAEPEPMFVKGVYDPESHNGRTWRWFGGRDAESALFVEQDIGEADSMTFYGNPMRSGEFQATVTLDGQVLGTAGLGERDGSSNSVIFSF